jgi:putative peptidoglycan lipid II flippase
MLRGVLTVGGWTMASRVLGLLRDMLMAALIGTGPVADAFFVANKLPNLFRRLFGEGAFNAAFVPEFAGLLASEGPGPAQLFAQEAFAVMVFWLGALTVLGEIFMPQVMTVFAPGFVDMPEKFALAVELARITFPYLMLICLAALLSGVLNGMDRFAAAAGAPLLYNLFSIAAMIGLTPYVATVGHATAWGVSVSGVVQLALLVWAVHRAGMKLHLPRPRLTPQVRLLLRRMAPGLIGASATQLNQVVDVVIASLLPAGTVSLLYYADRMQQLPLGVIGTAVGTALLPLLSRQVRGTEAHEAIGTLNRAIEYTLFLTLPAALALAVSGFPMMWVLFGRGAFDAESARLSAQALTAYAVGLPAVVLLKVLTPAFFARGDMATPVRIGLITLVLNLGLNLLFNAGIIAPAGMRPWLPRLDQIGPPLATSLAAVFNLVCLAVILARHGHFVADTPMRRRLPRMALAAGAMAGTLWFVQRLLFADIGNSGASQGQVGQGWLGHGWRWAALVMLVSSGVAVYLLAGQMFGAFDARDALRLLSRRALRRRDGSAISPTTEL